jgi:diacylglycerol kinase family enzyme
VATNPIAAEGPTSEAPSSSGLSPRIAVVVNGNAKNVTREIISTIHQILLGGDLFVSRSMGEADEIAKLVVARRYGTVLTGGGDGTFSVMVTKVFREAMLRGAPLPRFGFLKLGTGNALAHVVGASGSRSEGLAADIRRLREDAGSREIALVEVNGVLTPFCGFGVDAVVLRDYEAVKRVLGRTPLRKLGMGPAGYTIASVTRSLPGYVLRKPAHCRIINHGDECYRVGPKGLVPGSWIPRGGVLFDGPARLVAASTIPYYGYGFRAFPYAEERPDRMHLRISNLSIMPFLLHFRGIWRGEYQDPANVSDFLVQDVEIQMDPATPFQIGGDYEGERGELRIALAPKRIRLVDFYAPPNAD